MRLKTMSRSLVLGACCAMSAGFVVAGAQTKVDATAKVAPAKALDDLLNLYEGEFTAVANAMPADKYGFAPSQLIFAPSQKTEFTGVRTFGCDLCAGTDGEVRYGADVCGSD